MIANGNTPFCVGHRQRRRHRLADDRLDRGLHAPAEGPRGLRPVGQPRDPVRRPRRRSRSASTSTTCGRPRARCTAALQNIAATPFAEAGLPAARGRVHDAPPGQLLRRQLARGHRARRGRRGQRLLPARLATEFPNITLTRWHLRRRIHRPARGHAGDASSSPAPSTPMPGPPVGGFLSPEPGTSTPALYPTEIEQNFGEILANGRPGALRRQRPACRAPSAPATFWTAAVDIVTGDADGGGGLHGRRGELAHQLSIGAGELVARRPGRLTPAGGVHRTRDTRPTREEEPMGATRRHPRRASSSSSAVTLGAVRALNAVVDLAPRTSASSRPRRRARRRVRGRAGQQRRLVPRRPAVAASAAPSSAPLLGASCGRAGRRRPSARRRIPDRLRPVIFLAPALLFLVRRAGGARRSAPCT